MPQPSARNHRNNPYILDRAFVQVRHSAAGVIWRFRTELAVLTTGTTGALELAKAMTVTWAVAIAHRIRDHRHGPAVDPAVPHPAGLVCPVPPPHPEGVL